MQNNEYEQILIKCQYISAVCDSLVQNLETQALSKVFLKNKLSLKQQFQKISQNYIETQNHSNHIMFKEKKQQQAKQKQVQIQIEQMQVIAKKLNTEINLLKQNKQPDIKNSRAATKKIRQISQIQLQCTRLRRLLIFQTQNLNSLQISGFQLLNAIQTYERRQDKVRNKIDNIKEQQKQFMLFRELQQKYQNLFSFKKRLVSQINLAAQSNHQQTVKKTNALRQSHSNLAEMERYQKQLQTLIKQQVFVIDQISTREVSHSRDKHTEEMQEADNQIFQEEVQNLRKTIANRKFKQRVETIRAQNQFKALQNNPTPKNRGAGNQRVKNKQIFKIQIEPISHFAHSQKEQQQTRHRHSFPINLDTNNAKNQFSFPVGMDRKERDLRNASKQLPIKCQNKESLIDLDTVEMDMLQRILDKKQQQFKQALSISKTKQKYKNSPIQIQEKSTSTRKQIQSRKCRMHTQPISSKFANNQSLGPDSRYIEQIIYQSSPQNMKKFKANARIRTKQSQTQRYKFLQSQKCLSNEKKAILNPISIRNYSLKNDSSYFTETNQKVNKANSKTQQNTKRTSETLNKNQFLQLTSEIYKKPLSRNRNIKYQGRVKTLLSQKGDILNLLKKIQQLNIYQKGIKLKQNIEDRQPKIRQDKQQKIRQDRQLRTNQDKQQRIKVFKLCSKRKFGDSFSAQRKGKALGVQESQSDGSLQLPKIEEEDESIMNTRKSIDNI